jgi:AcrR family transcriptional regulator
MYKADMERNPAYKRVLEAFGHYGFRKASMGDLAEAAGVSRQTLYNRFQSKEGVLDWAAGGFIEESETLALAALAAPGALDERLLGFFVEWIGSGAEFLSKAPHGAEIMELGKSARARLAPDSEPRCRLALVDALRAERRGVGEAEEQGFVLTMASKGLMLAARDAEEYSAGMRRVIATVLG